MNLLRIISIFGLVLLTFGIVIPWIISNNLIPLYADIILFLIISYIYGKIFLFYMNKILLKIKKYMHKDYL